jgi:mannose-6-phosphate isomerase
MNVLYPLKFKPIFKDKIWGGNKIKTLFGKDYSPLPNCGESWELSGVEDNLSVVTNGFLAGNDLEELIEVYMADLVGEKNYEKFGLHFPILVKIIDSREWLSVQVHPDDALAMNRHQQNGKTEMWYILQADKNAQVISGFNCDMDKEKYLQCFNNGKLTEILNYESVQAGNVFYIPSGRIHALGPGVCLAEIQQTSDITYRIYDWDRTDKNGKSRELHIEQAIDAINFQRVESYKTKSTFIPNLSTNIIESPYFTTNILAFDKSIERDYIELDSFVIYLCTEGKFTIEYSHGKEIIQKGETVLIPAELHELRLIPEPAAKLLEVFIK